VQHLDVRRSTVLHAEGPTETRDSVFCPQRERSVALEACAACEISAGIRADGAGRPRYVDCRLAAMASAPVSPPPGRDDELVAKLSGPIADVMTRDALCVRADMTLEALRAVLIERGLGGLPVVDAEGRPLGMVTKTDLLRAEGCHDWHRAEEGARAEPRPAAGAAAGTVGAIMTELAIAVHESMSIAQAAALMAYEGVHRLPVVDDDQRLVGVLSSLDVMHWIGERAGYLMRAVAPHRPE
jgi:CBS domain-containing protein